MRLDGKVALVTGGGAGIGRATAIMFADAGAKVGVLSLVPEEVQAVVAEIQGAGHEALGLCADVRSESQVASAVAELAARWGRLDIVFANAGVNGVWAPVEEITESEFDWTVDVNLKGTFLTVKHCVEHLKKAGGAIVITSSVNGTGMFSNCGASVYGASKAAVAAMARMLAGELGRYKIRVNAVCPGHTRTQMHKNTISRNIERVKHRIVYEDGYRLLGARPARPEQVARLVLFLAGDEADHITGEVITIDAGETLIQG